MKIQLTYSNDCKRRKELQEAHLTKLKFEWSKAQPFETGKWRSPFANPMGVSWLLFT